MEIQNPLLLLAKWSPFTTVICNWTALQPCRIFHYPGFAGKGCSEFDAGEEVISKWTKNKTLYEWQRIVDIGLFIVII